MGQGVDTRPFGPDRVDLDRSPLEIKRLLSQPIWRELRIFLAVAKCSSFKEAAELCGSSGQTVSRDIQRLEDQLRMQLVVTTHSGAVLTAAGRSLALKLAELDYQLASLPNDLGLENNQVAGRVTISVTSGLAMTTVAPRIPQLNSLYPRLFVEIRDQVSFLHLEKNQTDLMIGLSAVDRADIRCQKVGMLHLIPVASRQYIERMGSPQRSRLAEHKFLQCSYYASEGAPWHGWRDLLNAGSVTHHCENSLAYFSLIKAGAGIGMLGNYMLADPNIAPLELGVHVPIPIYLITTINRLESKPVRVVYDWLADLFLKNQRFTDELDLSASSSPTDDGVRMVFNSN